MNVGLITIGNELLSGFTTDTNSAWIGQSVLEVGAEITWHVTIGDQSNHITATLDQVPEDIKVAEAKYLVSSSAKLYQKYNDDAELQVVSR